MKQKEKFPCQVSELVSYDDRSEFVYWEKRGGISGKYPKKEGWEVFSHAVRQHVRNKRYVGEFKFFNK